MEKKKILYVITKSVWGGAQKYVYDLATNLPRDEFDTAVVSGGRGPLIEKLHARGIRVVPLPALERDINLLKEIASLWSLIKICIREQPDIIHLSSSKAGGLGAVAAFTFKLLNFFTFKPTVVFTVHGWGFNEDRPLWQKSIIFFFSWLSTLFQDKVILIDSADYRTAERFMPKGKLALIRHGLAPIDFMPRDKAREFLAAKTGRSISPDTAIIGTIAELTKNKGINHLVDAINQVKIQNLPILFPERAERQNRGSSISQPNPQNLGEIGTNYKFQTLIIGDGEDKEKLQRQIDSLGLKDAICLAGFIPDAAQYLKAFDIFVLPSLKEGLPYSLMEAMAAGVPVVATDVGGVSDLIEHNISGLVVPPKNPAALAKAVAEMTAHPDAGRMMADSARRKIESKFAISAMISKTMALYSASNL